MAKIYSSRTYTIYGLSRTKFDILIIFKVNLSRVEIKQTIVYLFTYFISGNKSKQFALFGFTCHKVTPFSAFLLQIHLVSNNEYCVLRHSAKPLVSICFGQTTSTSFSTNNILNLLCYWQYLFFTIDVQVTFASFFFFFGFARIIQSLYILSTKWKLCQTTCAT